MKLSYRGISYDYTPPVVEASDEQTGGKYRGLDWRFRNLKKAPVQPATLELRYRGVAYRTHSTQVPETVAVQPVEPVQVPALATAAPVPSKGSATAERARSLMMAQHRVIKHRQQSLLHRSAAEVGLTTHVADYWNHIQGKIHPTFRINYDRSAVALS